MQIALCYLLARLLALEILVNTFVPQPTLGKLFQFSARGGTCGMSLCFQILLFLRQPSRDEPNVIFRTGSAKSVFICVVECFDLVPLGVMRYVYARCLLDNLGDQLKAIPES